MVLHNLCWIYFIIAVCSTAFAYESYPPEITPFSVPALEPRQVLSQEFVGYFNQPGSNDYTTWNCPEGFGPGYTWCTFGSYGGCQATSLGGVCNPYTACGASNVIKNPSTSATCTGNAYPTCVTDRIFESYGVASFVTWIVCGARQYDLYRASPTARPASQGTSGSSTSALPSQPTLSDSSAIPTTTKASASSTRKSPAWVLGVIVACIVIVLCC
ncbi:uncharacterized protein BDR25DRAFT_370591 [Lindgomyces ingoldianus]|uniref:Uncharacterized protein n=1 Tax=Lindgomyces ingoldianus TaxID=673940 RepID=A0ACB6QSC7_9PLEO|nr:uncharacterized protein BDR25DRAFT_370591 [Lindgomyces ingoldianus]KAF2469924.1 hypothetical protein BDR25DRAFT_370591 [Lindgomyces ingoldianus]